MELAPPTPCPLEEKFDFDPKNLPQTYKKQASALRKGEYVVLKDRPCVIVDMCTSK